MAARRFDSARSPGVRLLNVRGVESIEGETLNQATNRRAANRRAVNLKNEIRRPGRKER